MTQAEQKIGVSVLAQAISRKDSSGQPIYSREQVLQVITYLALTGVVDPTAVSGPVQHAVKQICIEAGLYDSHLQPKDVVKKIKAYYEKHPPHLPLIREIFDGLKSISQEAESQRLARAASATTKGSPQDLRGAFDHVPSGPRRPLSFRPTYRALRTQR